MADSWSDEVFYIGNLMMITASFDRLNTKENFMIPKRWLFSMVIYFDRLFSKSKKLLYSWNTLATHRYNGYTIKVPKTKLNLKLP